jgi:hypothetical protein
MVSSLRALVGRFGVALGIFWVSGLLLCPDWIDFILYPHNC